MPGHPVRPGAVMRVTTRKDLELAAKIGWLVRFRRRFEKSKIRGYVLDVGPRFFLLAVVSDRIWFDGFEVFRISDVRRLEPDPYDGFVQSALGARGETLRRSPGVSVASIEKILETANRAFSLVTIHRELVDPDCCWIGEVVRVRRGIVSLREICPDATWDDHPTDYRLREITRVNFGGDYEEALHLVGGPAPKEPSVS